jgi:hypothetical protein
MRSVKYTALTEGLSSGKSGEAELGFRRGRDMRHSEKVVGFRVVEREKWYEECGLLWEGK